MPTRVERRIASALVLWFVAVRDVTDDAVVDGVRVRPVWGRFFWFVRRRGDDRMYLRTDFERRRAGALVLDLELGLVVSCGGADGSGRRNINVDGLGFDTASGVDVAAVVVVTVVGEDVGVDVEGSGGGDNAGGAVTVVIAAAVGVGGVDVGDVVEVLVLQCASDVGLGGDVVYAGAVAIGGVGVAGTSIAGNAAVGVGVGVDGAVASALAVDVGALVLWFVAVHEVTNAAVVDGVRTRPMWGRFFWYVWMGCGARRDITTDVKRRQARALVLALGLVVRRGGAGGNMNGRDDVGATVVVEGVSVGVAGVVMTVAGAVVGRCVEVENAGGEGAGGNSVSDAAAIAAVGGIVTRGLKRGALRLVRAVRVGQKNGRNVVGRTRWGGV